MYTRCRKSALPKAIHSRIVYIWKGYQRATLLRSSKLFINAGCWTPGRALNSVSPRLPGIAYHFKHFSREISRIGASDNPSNLFFIEDIWFASDSRWIDCMSSFRDTVHIYVGIYTSFSRESIILITTRDIKDCSQKYTTVESEIYLGKEIQENNRWGCVAGGRGSRRSPSSRTNRSERNKISAIHPM